MHDDDILDILKKRYINIESEDEKRFLFTCRNSIYRSKKIAICAIDVSMSNDKKPIEKFIRNFYEINSDLGILCFVFFSHEVKSWKYVTNDIQLESLIEYYRDFNERGGSSHVDLIKQIDNFDDNLIEHVVIVGDLLSDFEESIKDAYFIKYVPTLVVITPSEGKIINFNEEKINNIGQIESFVWI